MTATTEYDVVVVGAGVIGSVVAAKLQALGASVLLIEAGARDDDRLAMLERYVAAPRKTMGAPYRTRDNQENAPSPDGPDDYYDHEGSPDKFRATYQRIAGGATWHWRGNVPRHVPSDFRMHSTYGVGLDWPITYEQLETLYCAAEHELGAAGDHVEWNGYLNATRSRPYRKHRAWGSLERAPYAEVLALVRDTLASAT